MGSECTAISMGGGSAAGVQIQLVPGICWEHSRAGICCLYLLTSCSLALGIQMLWVQVHPIHLGWVPTPWGMRSLEGSLGALLRSAVVGCCFPKPIFAPSPTEVQSSGCICTHHGVLCQHICITWAHICITWAHICLAGSATGSSRSYRSQGLSCLYCRSHTLSNNSGFRCHKTHGLTRPRSLPPPCMCRKSILHRAGILQQPRKSQQPTAPSCSLSAARTCRCLFYFSGNGGKNSSCENYLFCINSLESKPQQTLGINRITQNTVV